METNTNNTADVALDWDSVITSEKPHFEPRPALPKGTYHFRVNRAQRYRHEARPGGKVPSCPCMRMGMEILDEKGKLIGFADKQLFLTERLKWMLCEFFISIGQMKEGEPFQPDWDRLIDSQGLVMLEPKSRKKNDGTEVVYNEVIRFKARPADFREFVKADDAGSEEPAEVTPAPTSEDPDDIPF